MRSGEQFWRLVYDAYQRVYIHWLLGIEIQRNRSLQTIKMRQKHYIDSIIKRFGFENEQTYQLPMRMDVQLTSMGEITHDQQEYMDHTPYMNMIGALRYAADQTRPDISYVTGQLARHLQKYNSNLYLAAKHVLQYLKGSSDIWLVLGGHGNLTTQGFCDAVRLCSQVVTVKGSISP